MGRLRMEEVEGGVKGKRKCGGEIVEWLTNYPELVFHLAYFTEFPFLKEGVEFL